MTTDQTPCRCWDNSYALGHDGHCCFLHDDRNQGWRPDDQVCHLDEWQANQTSTGGAS